MLSLPRQAGTNACNRHPPKAAACMGVHVPSLHWFSGAFSVSQPKLAAASSGLLQPSQRVQAGPALLLGKVPQLFLLQESLSPPTPHSFCPLVICESQHWLGGGGGGGRQAQGRGILQMWEGENDKTLWFLFPWGPFLWCPLLHL